MNFQQFLKWYADQNKLMPCDLRRILNKNGFKCGKNTPNRWMNGKRTPDIFTQKKVAKLLQGEFVIEDDRVIILPRTADYNHTGTCSSNSLDNCSPKMTQDAA